jgi:outer membrane protein OmpA-like peptidoglycan-associated protein
MTSVRRLQALAAAIVLGWLAPGLSAAENAAPAGAKVLPIEAKVLDIVGISSGLEANLKELGAKVTEREIRMTLSADVLFDFDKADLKPVAVDSLRKVAEVLNAFKGPIAVEGHTDGKGTDAYNQPLSERRANSVKDWFVKNASVPASRIAAKGYGKTKPVGPNAKPDGSDDPDGRQKNRRVEIVVSK